MSWEKTTVGEIVTTRKGYAFKSSKYVNKGVPVVRVRITQWIVFQMLI